MQDDDVLEANELVAAVGPVDGAGKVDWSTDLCC